MVTAGSDAETVLNLLTLVLIVEATFHRQSSMFGLAAVGVVVNVPNVIARRFPPPARLLGSLLRGHERDFARLGGHPASTASARHATEEPLPRRLGHRLPWLLVGLLAPPWPPGRSEASTSNSPTTSACLFRPRRDLHANAVGTQTEALVIRALFGASLRSAFRLELLSGLSMGGLLGAAPHTCVWLVLGSPERATMVAISLFAACAVATVVAVGLPWRMNAVQRDPAFCSAPLATVVQNLLSLVISISPWRRRWLSEPSAAGRGARRIG